MAMVIYAIREGYGINQVKSTMTVGELIEYLQENAYEDEKIYIAHDEGYTYGGIRQNMFDTMDDPDDEDCEEE